MQKNDPFEQSDSKPAEEAANDVADTAGADKAMADTDAATSASDEGASDDRDQRIMALEAELSEARDQQLRALAEAENVRRRAQRDREEASRYGAVGLARDLLDVADNLRRALDAAPAGEEIDPSLKGLVDGISMVEKELTAVLERHHVRPVPGVGEAFDHNLHQAVVEMPTDGVPAGHIAQVLQTGYVLHDRLLRAAMVAVAKAPETTDTA